MAEKDHNEENDQEKYFDPKQYNTIFVKRGGETNTGDRVADLINIFTNPVNKVNRKEALELLRNNSSSAIPLMVEAIESEAAKEDLPMLIAACWEADLNFSSYLAFFTDLAIREDYLPALEAITVIENMQGPYDKEQVNASIEKVESFLKTDSSEKTALLSELLITLKSLPL